MEPSGANVEGGATHAFVGRVCAHRLEREEVKEEAMARMTQLNAAWRAEDAQTRRRREQELRHARQRADEEARAAREAKLRQKQQDEGDNTTLFDSHNMVVCDSRVVSLFTLSLSLLRGRVAAV